MRKWRRIAFELPRTNVTERERKEKGRDERIDRHLDIHSERDKDEDEKEKHTNTDTTTKRQGNK